LNFGHTVGHAVERCSDYQIPHGRAVAIGMAVITKRNKKIHGELTRVLKKYGIDYSCPFAADELLEKIAVDKKISNGKINLIFVDEIGRAEIKSTTLDGLKAVIEGGLA